MGIAVQIAATLSAAMLAILPARTEEAKSWIRDGEPVRHVVVTLNKSRTFQIDRPFKKLVPGSEEIADVQPLSDRSFYIQGKKIGTTNVLVFDENMQTVRMLDVEVAPDTASVRDKIVASTGNTRIRVSSANGQLVLSGEATDAVAVDRAVSVAKSLAQDSPVVNALKVASPQQVMLKVRFLEVTREADRELGVNWFLGTHGGARGLNTGLQTPGSSPTQHVTTNGIPIFQTIGTLAGTTSSPFGVALANLVNNGTTIDVLLSALEGKGLVRRLAEPDLIALSGDGANFLAGGEFPVPVVQSSSGTIPTISVDYRPFGVQLRFLPTVLASGIINLSLTPSVSELDFSNAVQVSGFTIPSLTKREARTTVELRDGQSFAVAGLLSATNKGNIAQLPWIGSVPVLGALFRSTAYQQNETDLVVIVTPHLVKPAAPGDHLATPMDQRLPANDVDAFVLGKLERRKEYVDYVTSGGSVEGPYGHIIQVEQVSNKPVAKR